MSRGDKQRGERGATLVEFAILAPLLFLLLFGVIELARLGYSYAEVRTAAREGARYATTTGDANGNSIPNFADCGGIRDAARGKLVLESLNDASIDITYYDPAGAVIAGCQGGLPNPTSSGNLDSGTLIEVSVEASFDAVVPIIEPFLDGIAFDNVQSRTINYGVLND